ncbi:MAG: hypothetical protein ACPGWR_08380, partial [Ardenticatenaceae bacterium]
AGMRVLPKPPRIIEQIHKMDRFRLRWTSVNERGRGAEWERGRGGELNIYYRYLRSVKRYLCSLLRY